MSGTELLNTDKDMSSRASDMTTSPFRAFSRSFRDLCISCIRVLYRITWTCLGWSLIIYVKRRIKLKPGISISILVKGSFKYYVINFLAFLPPPPSVINRNQDPTPPLTATLRNQGLTPHTNLTYSESLTKFGQFPSMDTLPAVRAALIELYVLKRIVIV